MTFAEAFDKFPQIDKKDRCVTIQLYVIEHEFLILALEQG